MSDNSPTLERQIITNMKSKNVKYGNIIINSRYMMHNRKKLFCERVSGENGETLNFFTKRTVSIDESNWREPVDNGYEILKERVTSDILFGLRLPVQLDPNSQLARPVVTIATFSSSACIIIKSPVYNIAEQIAQKQIECDQKGELFNFGSINLACEMGPAEYGKFMDNFWMNSRAAYRDVVYSDAKGGNSRFIKHAYKLHEFYKLMNAFVPVFVDCSLFFNPLRNSHVMNTKMYQLAVKKNRVVETTNSMYSLKAYFLTQEEICHAFNMHKFMRFNSVLWYNIFMGLLYQDDSAFPSVNKKMMRGPANVNSYGLARTMSQKEFAEKVNTAKRAIQFNAPVTFNGCETAPDEFIRILQMYHEVDSLWLACESSINSIARSGAHVFDDRSKITVEYIYNIMLEASL